MKALIQTGSSLSACGHAQAGGRVPVPHEKRFLINNCQASGWVGYRFHMHEQDAGAKRGGICRMIPEEYPLHSYESGIEEMADMSFQSCLSLAKTLVPPYSSQNPIYRELKRGTKILETEDQLNGYMAYYGEWHRDKISRVLPHVPDDVFKNPFELVDGGCGQGVGLFPVAEYPGEYAEN